MTFAWTVHLALFVFIHNVLCNMSVYVCSDILSCICVCRFKLFGLGVKHQVINLLILFNINLKQNEAQSARAESLHKGGN